MEYEIHITIDTKDINKFVDDCKKLKLNPIVIQTQNQIKFEHQVMTSSKYSGDSYNSTLFEVINKISFCGYNVRRSKVEIKPELTKNQNFIYYETHFRLKLPLDFNYTDLLEYCDNNNFHLSKNLFKVDKDFKYQMCTYRTRSDINLFKLVIDKFKSYLESEKIEFDKIEVEECIYDTNESVDNSWLN